MFLLNRGGKPTFVTKHSKTHIDLTIANRHAVDIGIDNWEVLDRATASDHKYISFKIGEFTPFQREFRNFKKANWMEYKQILDQNPLEVVEVKTPQQLDIETSDLVGAISIALDAVCPVRPALPFRPMGWWNKDLEILVPPSNINKRARFWAISWSRNCTDRAQLFTNASRETRMQ